MNTYITIDGGTTNTRVHLAQNGIVVKSMRFCLFSLKKTGGFISQ